MRTRFGLLGLAAVTLVACNKPSDFDGDGFAADVDCNDNDAAVHPEASETCDGIDNNCDNSIDGADAAGASTFYADLDTDGYGGSAITATQCDMPSGYVDNSDDCDDNSADINPDAAEICDGWDNDCDGLVDDEDDSVDTAGYSTYYGDADGDGYGDAETMADACDAPSGYTDNADDCDDMNATVNPESIWYADADSDGYGDANGTTQSCDEPAGFTGNPDDCDDGDALVNPDAMEICDGNVDNDCDGAADDADESVDASTYSTFYADADGDTYGDDAMPVSQCDLPSGYTVDNTDCDDTEILVNPSEVEVCDDGLDNDCSGDAPECGLPAYGSPIDSFADLAAGGTSPNNFGGTDIISGDFNGDGITDMAVSDSGGANSNSDYYAGTIEFFYGPISAGSALVADARIEGDDYGAYLGYDMANVGDVNADGADDIITGAYQTSTGAYKAGAVYLFSGPTSGTSYASSAQVGVGYGDETFGYYGKGVANLGDIDGDGDVDIAVGAPGYDDYDSGAGRVYVSASSAGSSLIFGENYYDSIGNYDALSGLGDLDGDGYDDWGMSSRQANSNYGAVWVYYGGTSVSWSSTYDADATFTSGASYNYFGARIDGGEDLDDDGYTDFLSNDESGTYVWTGGATRLTDADTYSIDISDSSVSYGYFDESDTSIADYNGDGSSDLTLTNYQNASYTGAVWTFNGPLSAGSYDVTDADSSLTGSGTYSYFGEANGAGDFNGDGSIDLAIGAQGDDAVYLFSGGSM
jgi:hypothetical protein